MADGGHKIFCEKFYVQLETEDNWFLNPATVEIFEQAFREHKKEMFNKSLDTDELPLCCILDHKNEVSYNFTDKKDKITMFSDGKYFIFFDEDLTPEQINAYKRFIFNDKQAKNDKYVYNLSSWLVNKGGENDSGK